MTSHGVCRHARSIALCVNEATCDCCIKSTWLHRLDIAAIFSSPSLICLFPMHSLAYGRSHTFIFTPKTGNDSLIFDIQRPKGVPYLVLHTELPRRFAVNLHTLLVYQYGDTLLSPCFVFGLITLSMFLVDHTEARRFSFCYIPLCRF